MWTIAIALLLLIASVALIKTKLSKPKAAGIEDFSFPTAAERPIQVLAGTRRISGPNVLWYGDLKTSPIKKVTKTGFSSKKTTIGYRYHMGVQLGICHGPDVILRGIKVGDKLAWAGTSTGGAISIDKPTLFGGDENGSGGISGTLRFYSGTLTQPSSDYLIGQVGAELVSPIRGVSYAVMEGMYIGNSSSPQAVVLALIEN